ncbi:MAG: alpha/beta fold hydrolase [Blautia massiliensis (ex Durand et al. 2017)]
MPTAGPGTWNERVQGAVEIEGDTLRYTVTGSGAPLLCIAGGGGDGDLFLPLADALAPDYKVITYDRRANAGSTMHHPDVFSLAQQARDAAAVLRAVGEPSACILGNSSGAVIALEFLRLFPEKVTGLIVHEPPVAKAHPDREKWLAFFQKCYDASFRPGGASLAATKFLFGIEVPALQMIRAQLRAERYLKQHGVPKKQTVPAQQASRYLIRQELLPVVRYDVDYDSLARAGGKAVFAVGEYAKAHGTFLYRAAEQLSARSGLPCVTVPGHHGSFMDDAPAWADRIRAITADYFG